MLDYDFRKPCFQKKGVTLPTVAVAFVWISLFFMNVLSLGFRRGGDLQQVLNGRPKVARVHLQWLCQ